MNSTLQAVIVTLGIFALAGLFGLIEALGGRRVWRRREEAERTRTTGVVVGFAEERHRYAHRHGSRCGHQPHSVRRYSHERKRTVLPRL